MPGQMSYGRLWKNIPHNFAQVMVYCHARASGGIGIRAWLRTMSERLRVRVPPRPQNKEAGRDSVWRLLFCRNEEGLEGERGAPVQRTGRASVVRRRKRATANFRALDRGPNTTFQLERHSNVAVSTQRPRAGVEEFSERRRGKYP